MVGTPHYVLLKEHHRVGPKMVPSRSGIECTAIYGFSDKGPYDTFCAHSNQVLMPYPLVKFYLREQTSAVGGSLKLVVIDAVKFDDSCLHAATMEAVLQAHENRLSQMIATHELTFDHESNAYRLDEVLL